ncbi:hypothetical protein N7523_008182 [Penicillium sp. IBT 18751x]|nr:hypothetical protein N7523_008182 [Penicillium sp. IBT 18751x]
MEQLINMNDLKAAQPAIKVCSQHSVESQASTPIASQVPSPVASPTGHHYEPLAPSIPNPNISLKKDEFTHLEHVAQPEVVRKFANPAPLGLCAFALTSFVSNAMNLYMANGTITGINISLALIYGGISQFLAGMWEMALGNTFGATTFCSFGAYWITFATLSEIDTTNSVVEKAIESCQAEILMGIFMMAWFIFTTLMLLCTLKSSIAMFLIFFFLDLNYLLLAITHFQCGSSSAIIATVQKAGGVCGILAAITAWYNAFAGVFDQSNGFFTVPLGHFPWSPVHHVHQANKQKEV